MYACIASQPATYRISRLMSHHNVSFGNAKGLITSLNITIDILTKRVSRSIIIKLILLIICLQKSHATQSVPQSVLHMSGHSMCTGTLRPPSSRKYVGASLRGTYTYAAGLVDEVAVSRS